MFVGLVACPQLALKQSILTSSAATRYGANYLGGTGTGGGVSPEAPGLASPAQHPPPEHHAGAGSDALQSTAGGAVWQGQHLPPNGAGYVPPPPPAGPAMTSSDSPAGGGGGGVPGAYSTAGGVAAPRPLQHAAGSAAPDEDEDEAARELRIALEEEIEFYGSKGSPAPVPAAAAAASGSGYLPTSAAADTSGGMAAAAAARNAEAGGQQQQDELAWVLEQSRLEAELEKSRQAVAEEGEEEMLARVLEESRREQEKKNAEELELQRVSKRSAALIWHRWQYCFVFLLCFLLERRCR